MNWNAFDLVSPAIERTQKRLFPFAFLEWLKLFIISLLAKTRGSGGNGFSSSNKGTGRKSGSFSEFTNNARESILENWIWGTMIFSLIFLIGTIWSYISSVFSFIFIDSVVEKKAHFTFKKNSSKGASLFLFRFTVTIISLAIFAALISPYIYNFMNANPIIQNLGIGYVIFSILFAIAYLLALWVLFLFVYDFAVPYMYIKGTTAWFSLKQVWSQIRTNKVETLVYWIARLIADIVITIIAMLIIILLLITFALLGGIIFLIGYLIYSISGALVLFVILGIIIGFLLICTFILTIIIILLPLSIFKKYFELMNFEKLMKLKILK